MPRIRSIKPEFWSDATVAQFDFFTRLFYIALWNFADDAGRGRALNRELAGFAFPHDEAISTQDIETALQTLADAGRIQLYDISGVRHYQVLNWLRHQSVNRPSQSKLPAPEGYLSAPVSLREPSVSTQGEEQEPSGSLPAISDIGVWNLEAGGRSLESGGRRQESGTRVAPDSLRAENPAPALPFVASDDSLPCPGSAGMPAPPGFCNGALPGEKPPPCASGEAVATVLNAAEVADLLDSHPPGDRRNYTLAEIGWGCQIVLERKDRPKSAKDVLFKSILPDVRGGKRPKARASPLPAATVPREPPKLREGVPPPKAVLDQLHAIGIGGIGRNLGPPASGPTQAENERRAALKAQLEQQLRQEGHNGTA